MYIVVCMYACIHICPRMEKSHCGWPRTAGCLVNCVSQKLMESNEES